jgi:hypothetical protein
MGFLRRRSLARTGVRCGVAVVVVASLGVQTPAFAGSAPRYRLATVGAYGGEPSIVSDSRGALYETTPSGGTLLYRSTDGGKTWNQATTADTSSGDDCLATDQSNAVYLCNLSGSQGVAPLQADVWKSVDQGTTWSHGAGLIPQCATSCSPFGVDRDWLAASIPPGGTTKNAEVVVMYHDFYGPSQIWVNISHDGGATFGAPQEVLASPAVTPGAVSGTLEAGLHVLQYDPGRGADRQTRPAARGTHLRGLDRSRPGAERHRLQRQPAAVLPYPVGVLFGRQRQDVDPAAGL